MKTEAFAAPLRQKLKMATTGNLDGQMSFNVSEHIAQKHSGDMRSVHHPAKSDRGQCSTRLNGR
jgi:hypothetical protein